MMIRAKSPMILLCAGLLLVGCSTPTQDQGPFLSSLGEGKGTVQGLREINEKLKPHVDQGGKELLELACQGLDNLGLSYGKLEKDQTSLSQRMQDLSLENKSLETQTAVLKVEHQQALDQYDGAWVGGQTMKWFWRLVLGYAGLSVALALMGGSGIGLLGGIARFMINLMPGGNIAAVGARLIGSRTIFPKRF